MTSRAAIIAVALVALVLTAAEWLIGMHLCDGAFVYPLDDTYIHMAMARQVSADGTWGFDPGIYAFASSSPLWTVILSLTFLIMGCHEWIPLVYANVFAAIALALAVDIWRRFGLSAKRQFFLGVVLALCVPFVTLANLGMEHALHAACVMGVVGSALASYGNKESHRAPAVLCIALCLGTATRYETLFLAGPIAAFFLLEKRWKVALSVTLASAIPVLAYGVYAVAHGGYFLPTSILLKTGAGRASLLGGVSDFLTNISPDSIHAYILLALMLALVAIHRAERCVRIVALVIAVAVGGHLVFAQVGWLYRYECYLVLAGLTVVPLFCGFGKAQSGTVEVDYLRLAPLVLAALLAFPFVIRGIEANIDTILAQREIYGQQFQVARVFASLPENQKGPVAVNDLGMVVYQSGAHVLDIWGLGSDDVARLKISRQMAPDRSAELFEEHHIRYAAFYPNWYTPAQLSPSLKPVASLRTGAHIICGGREVLFCVTRDEDREPFRNHLRSIASAFPKGSELVFRE